MGGKYEVCESGGHYIVCDGSVDGVGVCELGSVDTIIPCCDYYPCI